MSPIRITAAVLALFLLAPLAAGAGEDPPRPNPHLEKAKSLYRRLHYGQVVKRLERALQLKRNTRGQLCEIYALLGTVQVVLENQPAARRAFSKLLELEPAYSLGPDVSPKIANFFDRVKRELAPPVKFAGKPRYRTRPGAYPEIMVVVEDPGRTVGRVDLWCRDPQGKFRRKAMRPGPSGRYLGVFPVKSGQYPEGYRLSFYVQAVGSEGAQLASLGTRLDPLVFNIPPVPTRQPEPPPAVAADSPWYRQWWIWAVAGVALVGLTVGIGVAAGGSGDAPVGTLGTLTLDLGIRR